MKRVRQLVRLLRPGQDMEMPKEGRDKRTYTVFGGAAVLFIMLPCSFVVGFISYIMTVAMLEAGGSSEGMLFIIQFISACGLIFGLNVVINEFYFSSDIDYLLPLPVKTHELIFAKFFVTYLAESVMEFLVIFSAYVGYVIAIKPSAIGIVTGLIGTVTLPILPLVYCGIISLIVMYLFQGIRSRKVLNITLALMTILLIVGTFLSLRGLEGFSVDTYVSTLLENQNQLLNVLNIVFYPGYLLVTAATTGNWLNVILYLLFTGLALAAFLGLANLIYLPGLYAFKSVAAKKGTAEERAKKAKSHGIFRTYLSKELKIIFRTPAFVSNYILINFFWPVIILVFFYMQKGNDTINRFIEMHRSGNVAASVILLTVMLSFAALTAAANGIASSSFTREGAHIDFMKYIPVSYSLQIHVKGFVALIFCIPSFLIDVLIFMWLFKLSAFYTIFYFLIGVMMIFFMVCLGIWLDSMHPKLIWEDELNALRGNLNVFFNMAFAIIGTFLILGIGLLLYLIPHSTIGFIYTIFSILLLMLCIFMYRFSLKQTIKNMDNLSS